MAEEKLSPAEVEELLSLLIKMGMAVGNVTALVKDEEEFHCIRCHEKYLQRENAGSTCCIEHESFSGEGERMGPDIYHYTCKSCGEVGIEDGAGNGIDWPYHGICYEGPHTSDPEDVVYDGDNTLTCESVGCPGHEEVHCVRCHQTFSKLVNNGEGCFIDHVVFDSEPFFFDGTYRYTCDSCGQYGFKDKEGKEIDWPEDCYEGKHTVDVEDVNYDGDDTLTCASNGCLQVR
jgi:hypothetical protein